MNYTPGQILNNKQEYKDFANWTAVHPEAKLSARALGNYTYEIYALPEPEERLPSIPRYQLVLETPEEVQNFLNYIKEKK